MSTETKKTRIKPFEPSPESAVLNDDMERIVEIVEKLAPGKGANIVVQMAKEFAGTYVYFLQNDKMFRKPRNEWIIEQYEAGYRVADIARILQKSERQIWTILGREPAQNKQLNLFD